MKRLLILVGHNRYNVLDHYGAELGKGFERLGWEVTLYCTSKGEPLRFHPTLFDGVISPNATASMIHLGDRLLFDAKGVPQIGWMVDDPVHAYPRFTLGSEKIHYTCVDRDHIPLARRLASKGRPVHFCPLGASDLRWEEGDRPIDLLLCGSHRTYSSAIAEVDVEPRAGREVVEERLSRPIETIEECRQAGEIDLYYRSRCRERVLEALADAGLTVDIYGVGWDASPAASRHRIHPPVAVEEALTLLGKAILVVDTPTLFRDGPHDRVLTAPLAGAVPLVYWNRYYEKRFTRDKELIGYDWSDLHLLGDRARDLLENAPRRQEVAEHGAERVRCGEMWSHRAEVMAALLEEMVGE